MPSYRIFRLKEEQRQRFRWGPHTSGATGVRLKDYVEAGSIEAASVYAAWCHSPGAIKSASDEKCSCQSVVGFW